MDNAFYLRPLEKKFCKQAVGHSTLEGFMKSLMAEAGFFGHFTLHSLRATCATRLYETGVPEQQIMETTGHSSLAIREYQRTSDSMREKVSSIIQETTPLTSTETTVDEQESVKGTRSTMSTMSTSSSNRDVGPAKKKLKIEIGDLRVELNF